MTENNFSLEDRIPCSDGTCVGVVGDNGTCGTCGKTYDGDLQIPSKPEEQTTTETSTETDSDPVGERSETDTDERVVCPDDMCVGIIGESGKCGVCGKSV